jgi:ABC-type lipoprotein export system ATPase subunit
LHDRSGVSIIIATHDEDVALSAGRRIRMRDGSIVSDAQN